MSKVDFKLNLQGLNQLMTGPETQEAMSVCKEYADGVQRKAGEGYEVSTYVGRSRVNASVYAATHEARKDNYEHNTLLKARGGG